MAPRGKGRTSARQHLERLIPDLVTSALDERRDLVLCFETDEDTGKHKIHVMTGQFITPCMLRKLVGQAESQKDEGSTLISRAWR